MQVEQERRPSVSFKEFSCPVSSCSVFCVEREKLDWIFLYLMCPTITLIVCNEYFFELFLQIIALLFSLCSLFCRRKRDRYFCQLKYNRYCYSIYVRLRSLYFTLHSTVQLQLHLYRALLKSFFLQFNSICIDVCLL